MALRKIAVLGNPVLRKVAARVSEKEISSPKIQTLIQDMVETMFEYDGRGLAAPQIHESLQIVVMLMDFDPEKKPSITVLVNPAIKPLAKETSSYWEGCLSLPGLRGKVTRPNKISVEALNEKGQKIAFEADGFMATVVQHECDHLEGKLYVDRMTDMTEFAFSKEFGRFHAANAEVEGDGE